jgi:TonB family protein
MGKIVKHCTACDGNFGEKFSFCPNCGQSMQAFELNPVTEEATNVAEKANVGNAASGGSGFEAEAVNPAPVVYDTKSVFDKSEITFSEVKTSASDAVQLETTVEETKTFAAASGNGNGYKSQTSSDGYRTVESQSDVKSDDGFHVTVIEDKNGKQRNLLLLGSLLLVMTVAAGGMLYSLFNYNTSVAAIGDETGLSVPITDEVPMEVEETPKPKDNKDAGGGGGGGRDEPTPTSLGKLANQTEKPIIAPDKSIVQKDNFELKQPIASTQGNKTFPPSPLPYGDPNSRSTLSSNGMGSGGGQGSGIGNGQGSGRGTGAGSGIGSGFGSGRGSGEGGGTGSGREGAGSVSALPPPPPVKKADPPPAVTEPFKIISKPRPGYTDAARQNQVTGVVRLRVQFLASGQVGSVSPVSGLPNGLTEQAIAAAKSIKFEPMKKNGVAVGTTKVIEYSFTIY